MYKRQDLTVFADDIGALEAHADDVDTGSIEELVHLLGSQNCFVLRERFVFAAQILIVKLRIVDDDGGIETGYRRGDFDGFSCRVEAGFQGRCV